MVRVALVGNQNSGKTTLFNALTGSNQKVGNWPGVTVDKKEGWLIGNKNINIVDLPGIYSLAPYTSEERISRNYLIDENPDIIINIVDATNIERGLYLTTQLMELGIKVIVALNMIDLAKKKGIEFDLKKLNECLNLNVVAVSAKTGEGLGQLKKELENNERNLQRQIFSNELEKNILEFEKVAKEKLGKKLSRFALVKLLEGDFQICNHLKVSIEEIEKEARYRTKKIENENKLEILQVFASQRYAFIEGVRNKVLKRKKFKRSASEILDKVFLNKWLAIPIFLLLMLGVYYLSVGSLGKYISDLFAKGFLKFTFATENLLKSLGASGWVVSLVIDGIFKGVGSVLNFIPQLAILLTCVSLLESLGYMARISFIFDKLFRFFGLSGKSLIPFIIGSSCSVPAITSCRTIENEREKQATIALAPFIPCSAKLPMIVLICGYFFPITYWYVEISIYILAISLILISALVIKKFVGGKENGAFISELPEYKVPNIKYIFKDVFDKVWDFIQRAGTIILLFSCVIWFLISFNWKMQYGVDISNSILAGIGKAISWFFFPIFGEFNWGASVSAIQGLIAKEQVVSSLSIISGAESSANIFSSLIFSGFTSASAYGFMVFNLFSAPCVGTLGAMKSELKSTKKMLKIAFAQIILAWALAIICTCIGNLFIFFYA